MSGATRVLKSLASKADCLGYLVTPANGNSPESIKALGLPTAADNGAFSGLDPVAFTRMLCLYREADVKLDWVACPDVVADAVGTFKLWGRWHKVIEAFGYTPALVLQDGMTTQDVLDFSPKAIFIGGTTEFKLGQVPRTACKWARKRGVPVHMGRVNTAKRIKYAIEIGCTSCDGSGFSKWSEKRIPLGLKWIKRYTQPSLFT